jgi:predicted  nucleic acid-binding Zn-ribbon protein
MSAEKKSDITVQVLKSIRDEIKGLREDTNRRFKQMDKRFEKMEKNISQIRHDINYIVTRFDRDLLLIANDPEKVKTRLQTCEKHLGIQN